jgi:hypothetical protein
MPTLSIMHILFFSYHAISQQFLFRPEFGIFDNLDQIFNTESVSRIGICQGGAQNLRKAKPTPKQLNFHKLSDAGELKFCGCPTPAEPILETRAVYEKPKCVEIFSGRLGPADRKVFELAIHLARAHRCFCPFR